MRARRLVLLSLLSGGLLAWSPLARADAPFTYRTSLSAGLAPLQGLQDSGFLVFGGFIEGGLRLGDLPVTIGPRLGLHLAMANRTPYMFNTDVTLRTMLGPVVVEASGGWWLLGPSTVVAEPNGFPHASLGLGFGGGELGRESTGVTIEAGLLFGLGPFLGLQLFFGNAL